jgi:cytochrome P450
MQTAIEAIAGSGPSSFGINMFTADPPEHTHLRHVVSRAFTPQSISALEPRIHTIVDRLIDEALPRGEFDLKGDLAGPLPVIVVAELLGVDPDRQEDFRRWCDTLTEAVSLSPMDHEKRARVRQVSVDFHDYLVEVVESRRQNPKDDLISKVVRAEEEDGVLTSDEVISLVRLLLIAATETTTYLITNALLALLNHPELLKTVRENPSLIPNVIEETLRYDSPAQIMFREATRDVLLGGTTVPKGSSVAALIGSANRDERKFGDPDRFDIMRNAQGHLAFGYGIHFCLGAPLARLEGRIVLETLLSRFKSLTKKEESVTWVNSIMLRGPKRLDLIFEPAA